MFYVPPQFLHNHGKRVPQKAGGMLAVIPPRNARRALQEMFPKGYWVGDRPERAASADVPAFIWKETPKHLRVFFMRNPYHRVESLHRATYCRVKCPKAASLSAFVDWLRSKEAGIYGWSQAHWIRGGEKLGNMLWPEFDPDLVIQSEDLATGLNVIGVLPHKITEDDVPYVIAEGEIRPEYVVKEHDWRDEYDKATKRAVRKMFYEDFELGGYSTALEDA